MRKRAEPERDVCRRLSMFTPRLPPAQWAMCSRVFTPLRPLDEFHLVVESTPLTRRCAESHLAFCQRGGIGPPYRGPRTLSVGSATVFRER